MKRRIFSILFALCMVLCCTWSVAAAQEEDTCKVSTEETFIEALNDSKIKIIKLTNDITLTNNLTINREVKINLEGDYAINGNNDVTLTIENSTVVYIGDLTQANTTNATGIGKVYVPVVNNGDIGGSTSFYGKVTNNGIIRAAHFFYGEYEGEGYNYSTIDLILDTDAYVLDKIPEGWNYGDRKAQIKKEILRGQKTGVLPEISRKGWKFKGWYDGDNIVDTEKPLAEPKEKTLKAKWEFDNTSGYTLHMLTYDGNGSTGGKMDPQYFIAGEKLVLDRLEYEKVESYFLGWNTQKDAKGKAYRYNDVIIMGDTDINLYAQWIELTDENNTKRFHVCYHINDGNENEKMFDPDKAEYGYDWSKAVVQVKAWDYFGKTKPANKEFAGWSFNEDGSGTLFMFGDKVMSSELKDVNLYAVWEDVYAVSFNDGFGSTESKTVLRGEKASKPVDPTKAGYTFAGWYSGDTLFDFNTPITQSINLIAHWQKNSSSHTPYVQKPTLSFGDATDVKVETAADGSTVYTTAEGKLVLSKDGTTASIIPNDGYEVANVSVNGTDKGVLTTLTGLKTGDKIIVTFKQTAEAQSKAEIAQIKSLLGKMSLTARSSKTDKKNIKVTLKTDDETTAAIKEIKSLGYTVKYKYYRSTKKASKYAAKVTKTSKTYTNTNGKAGTRYYYKARVQVYDKDGKLIAQTALKQCKYATRIFG